MYNHSKHFPNWELCPQPHFIGGGFALHTPILISTRTITLQSNISEPNTSHPDMLSVELAYSLDYQNNCVWFPHSYTQIYPFSTGSDGKI